MGHGHGHGHGPELDAAVEVPRGPKTVLIGFLVVFAIVTVAGVAWLWPDGEKVAALSDGGQYAAPGVTFPEADVLEVQEPCASVAEVGAADDCGRVIARVAEGEGQGTRVTITVPPQVLESGLQRGDRVLLLATPAAEGRDASFSYYGIVRTTPVLVLFLVFVVVVLVVARWRGLYALCGLAFAALVIWQFLLPALLAGEPALLVGAVAAMAIMYVVLYTTHGWSLRTSAALAGTLGGIALTAVLSQLAVHANRVSGIGQEGGQELSALVGDLSFSGLFTCAVLVAGLGVLNDVTITQASAVWEIRAASPAMPRRRVFASGMRIGRDHIASTIYTMVFAYAGTALTVLLFLSLVDRPFLDLLTTEEIGEEVVRTLATSIGLVLAVPLTTLIAAVTLPPGTGEDDERDGYEEHELEPLD